MNKRKIPWCYCKSIYDITPDFFLAHNIKFVLTDLDNTLDLHSVKEPGPNAIKLKAMLDELGIRLIIISNNHKKRVVPYAQALGVTALYTAGKPFKRKAMKFLLAQGVSLTETIYFGDQVINDIGFANKLGVKTCLVELLDNDDQLATRINRLWDRPLRKKLHKNNLLTDWRETYEQNH